MKVEMRLIGAFREKEGVNEFVLEFTGHNAALREVMESGLARLAEQGRSMEKEYMVVAVDGKVVPAEAWDSTLVSDGQVVTVFPPLQGG